MHTAPRPPGTGRSLLLAALGLTALLSLPDLLASPADRVDSTEEKRPAPALEPPAHLYTHARTGQRVIQARISVPRGQWEVIDNEHLETLDTPLLVFDGDAGLPRGRLALKQEIQERIHRPAGIILGLYHSKLALEQNVNPPSANLPEARRQVRIQQQEQMRAQQEKRFDDFMNTSPWPSDPASRGLAPYFHVIPGVQVERGNSNRREVLIVELHPYVNDGKHFVLRANGRWSREPIREDWLRERGIEVTPVHEPGDFDLDPEAEPHRFLARLRTPASAPTAPLSVSLINHATSPGERRTLVLDLTNVEPGERAQFEDWIRERARQWELLARHAPTSLLRHWLDRHPDVYGVNVEPSRSPRDRRGRNPRRQANTTNMVNLLGGRAAIEETLQLQNLRVQRDTGRRHSRQEEMVAIDTIEGVQVPGHDYEELLGNEPGGEMALARQVPVDRLFVHVGDPALLARSLEAGLDFAFQASATVNSNALSYHLKERMLVRLGLQSDWVKILLESGAIAEIAMFSPDLFFIDGTELTVILRFQDAEKLAPLRRLLGLSDAGDGKILVRGGPHPSYWSLRDDFLILSSHRGELEQVIELSERGGEGSLGASAEFRYMLTRLPPGENTRGYVYFSDPFIRRMVGPEVKIGQYRRLLARATLEKLNAAVLHHRADGLEEEPTLERLVDLGYVEPGLDRDEYSLDAGFIAASKTYGRIGDLSTLSEVSVERVSPEEARAYEVYVRDYSRFWRQFFDPIAIRLDEMGKGEFQAEIFILPLIDSSIYEMVRGALLSREDDRALEIPALEPDPALVMSLNLTEEFRTRMLSNSATLLERTGIDPRIFDHLGPALHFAVLDADPVIALGSGDIFGGTGADLRRGFNSSQTLLFPLLSSMLTRPCKLYLEVDDENAVRNFLRRAGRYNPGINRRGFGFGDFEMDLGQHGEDDRWLLTMNIFGVIKYRLGILVRDGHLVISNQPWNADAEIRPDLPGTPSLAGARLSVSPGSVDRGLAGLFAAAMEKRKQASYQSEAFLTPLLLSGSADPEAASREHRERLGFTPSHPGPGQWIWTGTRLESEQFGSIHAPRQPRHRDGDTNFGLLRSVGDLSIELQMEDEGLRTRIRWRVR